MTRDCTPAFSPARRSLRTSPPPATRLIAHSIWANPECKLLPPLPSSCSKSIQHYGNRRISIRSKLINFARKAGRLSAAIQFYRHALQLSPDDHWSHHFLGLCALQNTLLEAAAGHLTASIALRPEFVWSYLARAVAFADLDDVPAALTDFETAERLQPGLYAICVNRGGVLLRQGRFEEDVRQFEQAAERDPKRPEPWLNLGEARRRMAAALQALGVRPGDQLALATDAASALEKELQEYAEGQLAESSRLVNAFVQFLNRLRRGDRSALATFAETIGLKQLTRSNKSPSKPDNAADQDLSAVWTAGTLDLVWGGMGGVMVDQLWTLGDALSSLWSAPPDANPVPAPAPDANEPGADNRDVNLRRTLPVPAAIPAPAPARPATDNPAAAIPPRTEQQPAAHLRGPSPSISAAAKTDPQAQVSQARSKTAVADQPEPRRAPRISEIWANTGST